MTVAEQLRTWHVQTSLDPTTLALMCPWPVCGQLSPVDPEKIADQVGRRLHCRFCGLPSTVPSNIQEEMCS